MTTLNRTQFAVLTIGFAWTMMDNIVSIHGAAMNKIRKKLVKNNTGLSVSIDDFIDMSFEDYSKSPEKLRGNFNMDKIDDLRTTLCVIELPDVVKIKMCFEAHAVEIDQYFGAITVDEALELQRLLNWMGMEIDFSTRRVSRAVGGAV